MMATPEPYDDIIRRLMTEDGGSKALIPLKILACTTAELTLTELWLVARYHTASYRADDWPLATLNDQTEWLRVHTGGLIEAVPPVGESEEGAGEDTARDEQTRKLPGRFPVEISRQKVQFVHKAVEEFIRAGDRLETSGRELVLTEHLLDTGHALICEVITTLPWPPPPGLETLASSLLHHLKAVDDSLPEGLSLFRLHDLHWRPFTLSSSSGGQSSTTDNRIVNGGAFIDPASRAPFEGLVRALLGFETFAIEDAEQLDLILPHMCMICFGLDRHEVDFGALPSTDQLNVLLFLAALGPRFGQQWQRVQAPFSLGRTGEGGHRLRMLRRLLDFNPAGGGSRKSSGLQSTLECSGQLTPAQLLHLGPALGRLHPAVRAASLSSLLVRLVLVESHEWVDEEERLVLAEALLMDRGRTRESEHVRGWIRGAATTGEVRLEGGVRTSLLGFAQRYRASRWVDLLRRGFEGELVTAREQGTEVISVPVRSALATTFGMAQDNTRV